MRYGHSVVVFMRRSFRDHPCFMVLFRAFGSTMHTQPSCSNACNASGSFVSYTPCSHPSPTQEVVELQAEQRIREHLTHTRTHIWLSWLARCGEVCHQEHTSTSGSARCAANIRPASLNCFSSITTCTSQVPTICSVWLSLSHYAFQRLLNLISCSSDWNQCFTDVVIGIVIISCFKDSVSAIQEQRYHHGSEVNLPTLAHQNEVNQCLLTPRTGLQPHSATDLNKIEGLPSMGQHTIDSYTWVFLSVGCPCVEIKHTWHLYRYLIHVAIRQHPGWEFPRCLGRSQMQDLPRTNPISAMRFPSPKIQAYRKHIHPQIS
jgi:hypothetical protein